MRSRACAKTARCKNDGAESETPILASAMPPDLMKNLLFMSKLRFQVSGTGCQVPAGQGLYRHLAPDTRPLLLLPFVFRCTKNQSDNLRLRIFNHGLRTLAK